jgi:hypothetical protein
MNQAMEADRNNKEEEEPEEIEPASSLDTTYVGDRYPPGPLKE